MELFIHFYLLLLPESNWEVCMVFICFVSSPEFDVVESPRLDWLWSRPPLYHETLDLSSLSPLFALKVDSGFFLF